MINKKFIALSAIAAICFGLTGCSSNSKEDEAQYGDAIVLHVYNCADYICETDEELETVSVLTQFEEYCKNTLNKNVKINYSTYETNEDLYNQLKAGGIQYDLVCPSDYMIEKMIMNDMLEPLTKEISNYQEYGSPYIKDTFNTLSTKTKDGNTVTFGQYAVPYMWGTVGFMYDPAVINDPADPINISSWDVIWDSNHKNYASLKDSVRDTYITATLHIYKEELNFAKDLYNKGLISAEDYNQKVSDVMNRCDDLTISLVQTALKEAKENVYEFEVDTGKENIINGKYAINLCWSGDAVYSLDLAEEESDFILNYKVPEEGSNVWFDGWVMPKGANVELAQELMNFLCDPSIASQNMNYVGYTSGMAGQDMWELVVDMYDEEDGTIEYDLTYFFDNTGIVDEDGNEMHKFIIHISEENVDRQLYAQYPDEETILRCAVMKDFGEQNDKVSEMWIKVKGNSVSWLIYVFLGAVVVVLVLFELKNTKSKRARKNRNKAR